MRCEEQPAKQGMPEATLRRELNLISRGGEGKEGGFPAPSTQASSDAGGHVPPSLGACGAAAPGGVGWGGGCVGPRHAGCSRLQRDSEVQNVCGQPAQLPDALQGLELWLRKRALSSLHVRRQEGPDFCRPLPFPPRLPALRSLQPRSHPPSPRWEASIHFTPLGRESCTLASNKRGMAVCVRGSLGAKTLGSRPGARERMDGVTPGEPGPRSPMSASSALPPLQWEMEQGHPGPHLCSYPTPVFLTAGGLAGPQQQKWGGAAWLHQCLQQNQILSADSPSRPVPCSFRLCTSLTLALDTPRQELSQREPSPFAHSKRLWHSSPVAVTTEPVLPGALLSPAVALGNAPYSSQLLPTMASQQDPNTTKSSSSHLPPSSSASSRSQG